MIKYLMIFPNEFENITTGELQLITEFSGLSMAENSLEDFRKVVNLINKIIKFPPSNTDGLPIYLHSYVNLMHVDLRDDEDDLEEDVIYEMNGKDIMGYIKIKKPLQENTVVQDLEFYE